MTDQSHPHFAFTASTPADLDAFLDRLRQFDIPFSGPLTRIRPPAPALGTPVSVEVYFNDPDGNHLEIDCANYPFYEGMHMGRCDRWDLYYSWRDWSAKYVSDEPVAGAEELPRLAGMNHYTLPVRDLELAEKFYVDVLGADLVHRSERDRVAKGLAKALQVHVKLCEGIDISLFQQQFGWLAVDSSHPHQAFDVPGADIDRWIEHFDNWGVPYKLVCRMREQPPSAPRSRSSCTSSIPMAITSSSTPSTILPPSSCTWARTTTSHWRMRTTTSQASELEDRPRCIPV